MKGLFEELQSLMARYRFRPLKRLSQHFLVSETLIESMAKQASLKDDDVVLEIGCGTGFLTRELLKHSSVIGFEIDESLQGLLEAEIQNPSFTLLKESVLKAELPKFSKIVSAPPYSISSEIMHLLFKQDFKLGILLFEKAFVEKILSMPGFKDYCATAVLSQYFFSISALQTANPEAFFPKPKTESQLISIIPERKFGIAKNDLLFEEFAKQLFRFKNKNFAKALQHSQAFLKAKLKTRNNAFEEFLDSSSISQTKVHLVEVKELVQAFNSLCNA